MSAISGLEGLRPTLNIIKYTKKIAIANKESIICGWTLIFKNLKKYKTNFIPVDSEHFSIWSLLDNNIVVLKRYLLQLLEVLLITPLNKFKLITPK